MFGILLLKGRVRANPCFSSLFNDWEVDCVERFLAYLQWQQVCKDVEDSLIWSVTKSGKFTIKSLYNVLELDLGGSFPMSGIWILRVQPKVNFFCMGVSVG